MMPITTLLQWGVLTAILLATWQIIKPFVGATLLAGVLVISTWHVHNAMAKYFKRASLRATILIVLWLFILGGPMLWLGYVFTENANLWLEYIRHYLQEKGLPSNLPSFIRDIPILGRELDQYWHNLTNNKEELTKLLTKMASPARDITWDSVRNTMNAIVQVILVLFIAWFMYFDAPRLISWLQRIAKRLGNQLGLEMLSTATQTVRAVLLGLVGSALGQSLTMALGLLICGVPNIGLLSATTFFLSLIPGGPALVWGGAAIWLYSQNAIGLAIFLAAWGLLIVSSVDNFLKPIVMSKGANQSLLLVTLGVFGGAMAFGFIGLFLGPVILGLAKNLLRVWLDDHWTERHDTKSSI
jgi:predicted PurR-regulated permease PerM